MRKIICYAKGLWKPQLPGKIPFWNRLKYYAPYHNFVDLPKYKEEGRIFHDMRCTVCGEISDHWIDVDDMSEGEVIAMMGGLALEAGADLKINDIPRGEK
jgi:hypothetical protein